MATEQHPPPLIVSVDRGSRIASAGESKFRQLLATNEIRSIRCGRRILVPIAEIERWIERQLGDAPDAA
jgi:excisionase family DNA binding protein